MSLPVVICVDDDESILISLKKLILRDFSASVRVEICTEVKGALNLIHDLYTQGIEVPLIISDYQMSEIDGECFLREIHRIYPKIIKVMLTGVAGKKIITRLVKEVSLYRFLLKPVDPIDLYLTILEGLRRYQQDQDLSAQLNSLQQVNQQLTQFTRSLEAVINDRQQLLQDLTDAIPGVVFQYFRRPDGTDGVSYLSQGVTALYGYTPSEIMKNPSFLWDPICTEDLPRIERAIETSAQNLTPFSQEYRIQTQQGELRWLSIQSIPQKFPDQSIRWSGVMLDISDRKRMDRALKALIEGTSNTTGKDFFQKLVEQIAITFEVDHVLLEAYTNHQGQTLAFYSDGQLRPITSCRVDKNPCAKVIEQGFYICPGNVQTEFPESQLLVDLIAESYIGTALYDKQGQVCGILSVIHRKSIHQTPQVLDILKIFATRAVAELERLQAENELQKLNETLEQHVVKRTEELQESRQMLELVIETIPQRIYWKDLNSKYLGCNSIFAQDAGLLTPKEVVGQRDYDLVWRDLAPAYEADDQEVIRQDITLINDVDQQPRADGSTMWLRTIKTSLKDSSGEIIGVLGSYEDISDRKQLEISLQVSESKLSQILDQAAAAITSFRLFPDRTWYFDYWSAGCEKIYGFTAEEMVADQSLWGSRVVPEDLEKLISYSFETLSKGEMGNFEYRFHHKDGSLRWTIASFSGEWDAASHCWVGTGVLTNITNLKQAEEKLQQTNLQLLETNTELARATRLKDEFLASMSHELRTPLNAILGISEGLQENIFGDLNAQQQHALSTIERSGNHLLSLINDILDLAKIEAGKIELHKESIEVQSFCEFSLTFVKQQALQKNIRLQTEIQPNLGVLELDERRISQSLINLLDNAVKFTPENGRITLSAILENLSLHPEDPNPQTWLKVTVTDTGIGIAPEDIGQLFQPFKQLDSRLTRQKPGTGLGLVLVKRIVELHKGKITVTSQVGQGSCFSIYLPYVTSTPERGTSDLESIGSPTVSEPSCPKPVNIHSHIQATETLSCAPVILLAEDNTANISTFSSYLKQRGYQVVLALNGQEAIDMTLSHCPDLILMDIQMPIMDGYEAIERIRSVPQYQATPIIALTAFAMEGEQERCLSIGASHYLSKPVRLSQLVATIEMLLATKASRSA